MTAKGWAWGSTAFLTLCCVPFVYPFVFLLGTALKPLAAFQLNATSWPAHPTLVNLKQAWNGASLGPALVHTLLAVGWGVLVTVTISALAAFWFYRHRSWLASVLHTILVGSMVLPPPIFIVPLYVMLSGWNLSNNLWVLGLVYSGWNSSFGIYLMSSYYHQAIPPELCEAADVDGASRVQQLLRVIAPLSTPGLATLAALAFVWSWGDLLISMVLIQNPSLRTLVVSCALLVNKFNVNIPENAAAALVAVVPSVIAFLLVQRFLVRGITLGVGK